MEDGPSINHCDYATTVEFGTMVPKKEKCLRLLDFQLETLASGILFGLIPISKSQQNGIEQ